MLITNSILQSYDRVNIPIVTMLIGGVVKIVLNYNLVAVPSVNIYGAPIGTLVCFAITAALNLMFVSRTTEDKPRYFAIFAKPLFASFLMAEGAKLAYRLLSRVLVLPSARLSLLLCVGGAIGFAVVLYVFLVLSMKIITRDDLMLLPRGEKLARLLKVR